MFKGTIMTAALICIILAMLYYAVQWQSKTKATQKYQEPDLEQQAKERIRHEINDYFDKKMIKNVNIQKLSKEYEEFGFLQKIEAKNKFLLVAGVKLQHYDLCLSQLVDDLEFDTITIAIGKMIEEITNARLGLRVTC